MASATVVAHLHLLSVVAVGIVADGGEQIATVDIAEDIDTVVEKVIAQDIKRENVMHPETISMVRSEIKTVAV